MLRAFHFIFLSLGIEFVHWLYCFLRVYFCDSSVIRFRLFCELIDEDSFVPLADRCMWIVNHQLSFLFTTWAEDVTCNNKPPIKFKTGLRMKSLSQSRELEGGALHRAVNLRAQHDFGRKVRPVNSDEVVFKDYRFYRQCTPVLTSNPLTIPVTSF